MNVKKFKILMISIFILSSVFIEIRASDFTLKIIGSGLIAVGLAVFFKKNTISEEQKELIIITTLTEAQNNGFMRMGDAELHRLAASTKEKLALKNE